MVQTVCRLGGKYSRDGSTETKKNAVHGGKTGRQNCSVVNFSVFFRLKNTPITCYIVVAHKVGKGECFD